MEQAGGLVGSLVVSVCALSLVRVISSKVCFVERDSSSVMVLRAKNQ